MRVRDARRAMRGIGLAAVLVVMVLLGVLLLRTPPREDPGALLARFPDSDSCRSCHPDAFDEWRASRHATAYVDPEFRKLSKDYRTEDCIPCHAPVPVLRTGLYQRVLARYDRLEEGVGCHACHRGEHGFVGPFPYLTGACNPTVTEDLRSDGLCYGCHNQHKTHDQWRETPFFAKGVTCIGCHMPRRVRPTARGGRSRPGGHHGFRGMGDLAWSREAMHFKVSLVEGAGASPQEVEPAGAGEDPGASAGRALSIEVGNTGAGHNIPTDSRHKAVDLVLRVRDGGGTLVRDERIARFRDPYRDEPGENTQIPYGVTKRYRVSLAPAAGTARVLLLYKQNPFQPDGEATILFEEEVSW